MSHPVRVFVIEDSAGRSAVVASALAAVPGLAVTGVPRAIVRAAATERQPEAVVLLGTDRLDALDELRQAVPGIPAIVITTSASLEDAVAALRHGVGEFLVEPVPPGALAGHLTRLAGDYRAKAAVAPTHQRVLAIGAHPDDVEAGVGGVLARHRAAGDEVTILTLSRGRRDGGVELAWQEASASAAKIGAALRMEDELGDFSKITSVVRRAVLELDPTVVYTHSEHDRRQDHRLVSEATVAATEDVGTVACYQGMTSTIEFSPTRFVSIDGFTEVKLAMLACFATRGDKPRYLDPELVTAIARYWSQFGQAHHCEPLEIIREAVVSLVGTGTAPIAWQTAHEDRMPLAAPVAV